MKGIAQVVSRGKRTTGPEVMPPKPVTYAVKRALGLPIFGVVRLPQPDGRYFYTLRRIA